MKLTKKIIEDFSCEGTPPKRDIRWDSEISGFGVRIYPSGKKTFILMYRIDGRKHMLTIGDFGIFTLDQARKAAIKNLAMIHSGENPKSRSVLSKEMKFKELCDIYLSRYARIHKKTASEDERRINRHLIPLWGNHLVKSLSRNDVMVFHAQLGKSAPYEANRILRLIQKIFSLALEWGVVEETGSNPAQGIRLFKEEKRDRWHFFEYVVHKSLKLEHVSHHL